MYFIEIDAYRTFFLSLVSSIFLSPYFSFINLQTERENIE